MRAINTANSIVAAAGKRDLSDLRLLTLRVTKVKPQPEGLADHLDLLSGAINKSAPYLSNLNLIAPVLSVPQIRLDQNADLDVHLHALWHVTPEKLDEVRARLEQYFEGGVWIDRRGIHDLWRSAFYMASGVLDYPTVPNWPLEVIKAVWEQKHRRMIRPAGWYADYIKTKNANAPDKRQETPRRLSGTAVNPDQRQGSKRHQGPAMTATKPGKGTDGDAGGKIISAKSTLNGAPFTPPYTVRSVVPESSYYDPSLAPTVDDLWVTFHVVSARMLDPAEETFDEVCHRLRIKTEVARRSVETVEDYLRTHLFFPGGDWTPTDRGRTFAQAGRPILQDLDMLAVSLGSEAVWAGSPGRIEFENRIGMKAKD
jgi:hypothetical protein